MHINTQPLTSSSFESSDDDKQVNKQVSSSVTTAGEKCIQGCGNPEKQGTQKTFCRIGALSYIPIIRIKWDGNPHRGMKPQIHLPLCWLKSSNFLPASSPLLYSVSRLRSSHFRSCKENKNINYLEK